VIERIYGAGALPASPPVYAKKVKNAQEAHEAIRPTKADRLPAAIRSALTPDQDKLYTLIWRRFIASQMTPAVYDVTTVTVLTSRGGEALPYVFRATGRELIDPGFLRVYDVGDEPGDEDSAQNEHLPPLAKGDALVCHQLLPKQHFTKPPPEFTDAALIQELERLGIGRPSTFASIVDTLYERDYVARVPGSRALRSTELGRVVCDFVVQHFPTLFEVGFTARMEDQLDEIANGQAKWPAVMAEMWAPLSALLARAQTVVATGPKIRVAAAGAGEAQPARRRRGAAMRRGGRRARGSAAQPAEAATRRLAAETTGADCPKCGKPLVKRTSKFGPFVGCSGFPECRYVHR
jgi:DNA topoisomerase-1